MRLSDGSTIPGVDLAVWVTGAKPNSEAFRVALKEHVNEDGRLKVDPSLLLPGTANVFAVGDCAESSSPKTAYHGRKQADLVAKSLRALAAGRKPSSLPAFDAGGPGLLVPVGSKRGSGSVVICGSSVMASDNFVSSLKGADLFTKQTWSEFGRREE